MKPIKQIIAKNLVDLRKSNKLTQLELAEKLNYSDKAISRWEQGETLPDIDVLCQIAELYQVPFEYLFRENENFEAMSKKERTNKVTITLLAVSLVWFLATIIFVYFNIILNQNVWKVFIWAVPVSMAVVLVFHAIWGRRIKKLKYLLLSILVWSFLVSVYIQFIEYNIWLVFILGAPMQLAIILWSTLKVSA